MVLIFLNTSFDKTVQIYIFLLRGKGCTPWILKYFQLFVDVRALGSPTLTSKERPSALSSCAQPSLPAYLRTIKTISANRISMKLVFLQLTSITTHKTWRTRHAHHFRTTRGSQAKERQKTENSDFLKQTGTVQFEQLETTSIMHFNNN